MFDGWLICAALLSLAGIALRARALRARLARSLAEAVALADAAPDGILVVAEDGRILLANARMTALLGYPPELLIAQNVDSLLPDAARAAHRDSRRRFHAAPASRPMGSGRPLHARRRDGSLLPVGISLSNTTYGGKPVTICFLRDISEAQRVRAALTEANEELRRGMAALETQTHLLRELEQASELLQCCAVEREVLDLLAHWPTRLAPGSRGRLYLHVGARDELEHVASWGVGDEGAELRPPRLTAAECWALRRARAHRSAADQEHSRCRHAPDATGTQLLCIPLQAQGETLGLLTASGAADVLGELQEQLLHAMADRAAVALANIRLRDALRAQTIVDPLTSVFNRRHFTEALERELGHVRRLEGTLALLLLDVDHFKRLNDSAGHQAGDAVLRALGAALQKAVRECDVAARLGGDEFAVLLVDVDAGYALRFAERLRTQLRHLRVRDGEAVLPPQSLSVGIALSPRDSVDAESLLRQADERLYAAKRAGRDRAVIGIDADTQDVKHVGT
jgi:diguanylate cyclase (GGDEF)-like protein/PAS domain S-box-containing protein